MSIVIIVAPVGRGRFRASYGGKVLVEASSTPFLDAARVLAGDGVDPTTRIVMRHQGKDYDALISTVGGAAGLEVNGEYFAKHRPRGEASQTTVKTAAHASKPVGGRSTHPDAPALPGLDAGRACSTRDHSPPPISAESVAIPLKSPTGSDRGATR